MAGKRHHILPQFLLRGFASKTIPSSGRSDSVFVWVYRRGVIPFECATSNAAVESHFYGKEGEANVDDEITALESDFASSLNTLRIQVDGHLISDDKVIQFIIILARAQNTFAIRSSTPLASWLTVFSATYPITTIGKHGASNT